MSTNVFERPSFITKEAMRHLKTNLSFLRNTTGSEYASRFTGEPKPGDSISVRLPNEVTVRSGETFSAGNHVERKTSMTVGTTLGVDLEFTNRELMYNFEGFSEKVIKPAMMKLAADMESTHLTLAYKGVPKYIGTPGTVPSALKTYNTARARMLNAGSDPANHVLLITPDMNVEAVDAGKGLFYPDAIGGQYRTGKLSPVAGASEVFESFVLPTHTVGAYTVSAVGGYAEMNGSTTSGATSLVTNGWGNSVTGLLKAGDILTIEGVFDVHPITKARLPYLKQLVVTADVDSDGSGNAIIPYRCASGSATSGVASYGMVSSGAYQNVSAMPADNADIYVWGKDAAAGSVAASTLTPMGLRYQADAFLFCTLDQPVPGGVEIARMESDPDTGIRVRFIRDWDTKANQQINRFDVVPAWGLGQIERAVRIAS